MKLICHLPPERLAMAMALIHILVCSPTTAEEGTPTSLRVSIRHVVDGRPLLLDSLRYKNGDQADTFSVTRLSYLLSGFSLETDEGQTVRLEDEVAWVDLSSRRTVFSLGRIPAGVYRSLQFFIGPDARTNKAKPASFPADHPFNPNVNQLHWNWQDGFIFLALEGLFQATGSKPSGYIYHLARDPNRTAITLSSTFDLSGPASCEIDFDLAHLLNAPRPISFRRDGRSTHSHPGDGIAESLTKNLPGSFRVRRITDHRPAVSRPSSLKPIDLPPNPEPYPLRISRSFPLPNLPRDNPLLRERVALGKRLFEDKQLSRDATVACASCHLQTHALTDPRQYSIGIDGQKGKRNAMPLFNLAWKSSFFWDGRAPSLRAQSLMPIEDHLEMGESLENVVTKLEGQASYRQAFGRAFTDDSITPERISLALENFLLTLTSYQSRFDRALQGKEKLTPSEQRGFELFMTEYEPRSNRFGADCFHCHGGPLFTDHQFHNTGLDPLESMDPGRFAVTGEERDRGRFSTPSLRNVALTGPYMHDGRFQTLEEVINHYNSGLARNPTLDPNLAKHPEGGLGMTETDKQAIVDFLKTLTDEKWNRAHSPATPAP
ncbi:MAG: MbnP family protein [Verrucomicrobiota bacterium]